MFKVENNLERIKNLDTILVQVSDLKKISAKLKDADENLPFLGLFPECVIKFQDYSKNLDVLIHFEEMDNKVVRLDAYGVFKNRKKTLNLFTSTVDYKKHTNRVENAKFNISFEIYKKQINKDKVPFYNDIEIIMVGVFSYIHMIQRDKEIEVIEVEKEKKPEKTPSGKKKEKTYDPNKKKTVMIDDIQIITKNINNVKDILKKKYKKHIDSWSVRGHYRRLKNGKKVFVKGYIKGDKNKVKGKEYQVV